MPENDQNESVPVTEPKRRRFWRRKRWFRDLPRWQRRSIRTLLGLGLVVVLALVVLTRSPLTAAIVLPRLAVAFNLDIDAASVYVRTNGELVIEQARVRIPGVPGPEGLFLQVERVVADVDWGAAFGGSTRIRTVVFHKPVPRISQSIVDGSLNIDALVLPKGSGSGMPAMLPTIVAEDAAIELAEHGDGAFRSLKRMPVKGLLTPSARGPGYDVSLQELVTRTIGGGPPKPGFRLRGTVGDGIDLSMESFTLSDWPASTIPTATRQLFGDLGLEGEVSRATLAYSATDGLTAKLTLTSVGMNLPVNEGESARRRLRMQEVNGMIEFRRDQVLAEVGGKLEDFPYEVTLRYDGVTPTSPFTCTIVSRDFQIERFPRLLPHAPEMVRYRLRQFSGPTATLTTRLQLSRGPAVEGVVPEVEFRCWLDVSNGRAAFERFPYPFEQLSGKVYFDNSRVEFTDVHGVSASGAVLRAHGTLSPPTEDALIDFYVDVTGAPLDPLLARGFGPKRQQRMTALFNVERYNELLAAGLVISPEQERKLRAELETARRRLAESGPEAQGAAAGHVADLERRLAAPVFNFRGNVDVAIHVHRPPGVDVDWDTNVEVRLADVGLVPGKFPYPIRAQDLVCTVRNEDAVLKGGIYSGITGGRAEVSATFRLPPSDSDDDSSRPDISIVARDVPLDSLLLHALPGADPSEDSGSIKRILRDSGISGMGSAHVRIAPPDVLGRAGAPTGGDESAFDAEIVISRAQAAPGGGAAALDAITGTIKVNESTLAMSLNGRVGENPEGRVAIDATARFDGPDIDATVSSPALDVAADIERVVRVFSQGAADQLLHLRERYRPAGTINAVTAVTVRDGQATGVRVDLSVDKAGASFTAVDGRFGLGASEGGARVEAVGDRRIELDGFRVPVTYEDQPVGVVTLTGVRGFGEAAERPPLRVEVADGRFESALPVRLVSGALGAERGARLAAWEARGRFDGSFLVGGDGESFRLVSGRIHPNSLGLTRNGLPLEFREIDGLLEFGPDGGSVTALNARAGAWSMHGEGSWRSLEEGVQIDALFGLKGTELTPDLKALMPEAVREAVDELRFTIAGPFALEEARLTMFEGKESSGDRSAFSGLVKFENASVEAGVPIVGANGRMDMEYKRAADADVPTWALFVTADRLEVAGADTTNGRARIESGNEAGEIIIPLLSGECHGGRFAGRVHVRAPADGLPRAYASDFQVSGVEFGALLRDLSAETESTPGGVASRGVIDGELTLGGLAGADESRRGRGTIRIWGDKVRVLSLPFVLPLIEVSNLQLPAGERLDYSHANFFIEGGMVAFQELGVYSSAVAINGSGMMTWPGLELDLRFNSRSARPIPLVSRLVEGIRDQLVSTSVKGTLGKPVVSLVTVPQTRRILDRAVGPRSSEQDRRLAEMERRLVPNRNPIRPSAPGIEGRRPEASVPTDEPDPR